MLAWTQRAPILPADETASRHRQLILWRSAFVLDLRSETVQEGEEACVWMVVGALRTENLALFRF
jgi:hypothetical protein